MGKLSISDTIIKFNSSLCVYVAFFGPEYGHQNYSIDWSEWIGQSFLQFVELSSNNKTIRLKRGHSLDYILDLVVK